MCRFVVRTLDSYIDKASVLFRIFMKVLGPCLICLALSLISFVTYTFLVYVVPQLEDLTLPGQVAITSVGIFLLLNALYNYWKSMSMDPGTPPEYSEVRTQMELEAEELGRPKPRQCSRCPRFKPPRCHHCSICGRCVLKMDHHCPWINNCVGWNNYRYFCLFMFFLAASCSFVVIVLLETGLVFHIRKLNDDMDMYTAREYIEISFLICCSILIALCALGGFHFYLVLTNQTTIEFQSNLGRRIDLRRSGEYFRNPYDLGRTRNFQQVFGPNPFCQLRWSMSWLAKGPSGDGMSFPSLRLSNY